MSESIYEALRLCTEAEVYTFAVLGPKDDDTQERKDYLKKEMDEVMGLVKLELLRDISGNYQHMISHCQEDHGFSYKVIEMTETGILMFTDAVKRKVN